MFQVRAIPRPHVVAQATARQRVEGAPTLRGPLFVAASSVLVASVLVLLCAGPASAAHLPIQWQVEASDGAAYDRLGASVDVEPRILVVSAEGADPSGVDSGAAYVYRWDGMAWREDAKLVASDGATDDRFGRVVDLDGSAVATGAHRHDAVHTNAGAAYVYRWDGSAWVEAKVTASDAKPFDFFGRSVAMHGDRLAVGAYGVDGTGSESGAVYVFTWDGTTWVEDAKLTPPAAPAGHRFGWNLHLKGDLLVVAGDDAATSSDPGGVVVFRWSGTAWQEEATLTPATAVAGDRLGAALRIEGGRIAVGAPGHGGEGADAGAVFTFRWDGTTWKEETPLVAPEGMMDFGLSLALDGSRMVVGSTSEEVRLYKHSGSGWDDADEFTWPRYEGDRFGAAVGLSANLLVAGVPADNTTAEEAGAVAIHDLDTRRAAPTVRMHDVLFPTDPRGGADFGYAVDRDGDRIIVGARGDPAAEDAAEGAAYIFVRTPDGWQEEQKLKVTTDLGSTGSFATAVAISGDVAVVGDYGVASNSGAIYVFTRTAGTWAFETKLTHPGTGLLAHPFGGLAFEGTTLVASSIAEDAPAENSGAAHVFERTDSGWNHHQRLTVPDSVLLGYDLALDGDALSISDVEGPVVFRRSGGMWTQEADLRSFGGTWADLDANTLALHGKVLREVGPDWVQDGVTSSGYPRVDGDTVIAGIDVFVRGTYNWLETATLSAPDPLSVRYDFDDGYVVIGDPGHGGAAGSNQGAVILFDASDQDGDGHTWTDNCPTTWNQGLMDHDADLYGDACDADDDDDGLADGHDQCPLGDTGWVTGPATDHDNDGCQDAGEDLDDDGDGVLDTVDHCPAGDLGWTPSGATDYDGDGCRDATEDTDDDDDQVLDVSDACPLGDTGWISGSVTDYDGDGCRDATEDLDDDNDGHPDVEDVCPRDANCPPEPPTDLTVTLVEGPGNLELTWQPSPNPDIAAYRIYRGETLPDLVFHAEVGNITTFLDQGVPYGVPLHYGVAAVTAGEGPPGAPATGLFLDEEPPQVHMVVPEQAWFREAFSIVITESDAPTGLASCAIRVTNAGQVTRDAARPCQQDAAVTVGVGADCRHAGVAACEVVVRAQDWVGNEASVTRALSIDYEPPLTTISLVGSAGEQGWWTGPVTATLACSDDTSGCDTTTLTMDGTPAPYTEPVVLTEGVHALRFHSLDVAGNPEAPQEAAVAVDTTAPTTVATLSGLRGDAPWWVGPVTVCVEASDATSGVAAAFLLLDDQAPGDGDASEPCLTVAEDGWHEVTYWSRDVAGNLEAEQKVDIHLDQVAPATTHALAGTTGAAGWWVSPVAVTLTCEDATSGCASTLHRVAAVEEEPTEEGSRFTVEDGVHAVTYRSRDHAGLVEETRSFPLQVDATPPEVAIVDPVPGRAYVLDIAEADSPMEGRTLVVGAKTLEVDASDATSGMERVEFFVDDVLRATVLTVDLEPGEPYSWLWPAGDEVQGNHTLRATAHDVAGNTASHILEVTTVPTSPASLLQSPGTLPAGWEEHVLFHQEVPLTGRDGPSVAPCDVDPGVCGPVLEVQGRPSADDPRIYEVHTWVAGNPIPGPATFNSGSPLPPLHMALAELPQVHIPLVDSHLFLRVTHRYDPAQPLCQVGLGTCLLQVPWDPFDTDWVVSEGARASVVVDWVLVSASGSSLPVALGGVGPLDPVDKVGLPDGRWAASGTVVLPLVGQATGGYGL